MDNVKSKRLNIGSIVISKDPTKSDYLKIRGDLKEPLVLNAGDYLSVETVKFQLANLDRLQEKGILSADVVQKSKERIEQQVAKRKEISGGQDFVRAEVFVTRK